MIKMGTDEGINNSAKFDDEKEKFKNAGLLDALLYLLFELLSRRDDTNLQKNFNESMMSTTFKIQVRVVAMRRYVEPRNILS